MRTTAAVIRTLGLKLPYASSRPFSIEEVDLASPGVGEVLVEIAAAGLCHSDLSVVDGSRPRPLPMVLGHEASGVVKELGEGVTDLAVGDHVVFSFVASCGRCDFCTGGRPGLCEPGIKANVEGTMLRGGCRLADPSGKGIFHHLGVSGFARHAVASRESLVRIDPDLPLERAALFGCAIMTGVGAVMNTARVGPGDSVAVFGSGGVGLSVVMGARAAGAGRIIAVDRLESKLDRAREVGGTDGVVAKGDVIAKVRDLSGGGVDHAFETAGLAVTLSQAYGATRRGGKTIVISLAPPAVKMEFPAVSLVAEERTVLGSFMGSSVPARDIPRLVSLHQRGLLPVDRLVSREIGLEEINDGFDALSSGEAARQIVRMDR